MISVVGGKKGSSQRIPLSAVPPPTGHQQYKCTPEQIAGIKKKYQDNIKEKKKEPKKKKQHPTKTHEYSS
jgi:hypothetical protein